MIEKPIAHLLAVTAVTPLCGKLDDLDRRKIVLHGALVHFLVGSAQSRGQ
jgi:hypothetical protein